MPRRRLPIDPYFLAGLVSVLAAVGLFASKTWSAGTRTLEALPTGLLAQLEASAPAYRLGAADQPIQVVEIFDYQCPACAVAHRSTAGALKDYIDRGIASYAVYDVPLPSHGNAFPAAVMARCIHIGDPAAFWRFRDAVLAAQADWTSAYPVEPILLSLAARAGADTGAVRNCIARDGTRIMGQLRSARELAGRANLNFTPIWTVNGRVIAWDRLERELAAAAAADRDASPRRKR